MLKPVKTNVSLKLMVAILTAASFVISPAIVHAGEKGDKKKAEMMVKKEAKKAHTGKSGGAKPLRYDGKPKKGDCTAPKKNKKKGSNKVEIGDLPCTR